MPNRYTDQGDPYYRSSRGEGYPYDNNEDYRDHYDDNRSDDYLYSRQREQSRDDDYGYRAGYDRGRGYYTQSNNLTQDNAYSEPPLKHRGKGPKGYMRSDERIKEDVCDALMDDNEVDASEIEVSVKKGEVTLEGTVDSRQAKRRAEQCTDRCTGVIDVHNNLKINSKENTPEKNRSGQ